MSHPDSVRSQENAQENAALDDFERLTSDEGPVARLDPALRTIVSRLIAISPYEPAQIASFALKDLDSKEPLSFAGNMH